MDFGTNHLGHFLLTLTILPLVQKSAATGFHPRIIILSSIVHEGASINWDDINWEKSHDGQKAYGMSKLANLMFAMELAR